MTPKDACIFGLIITNTVADKQLKTFIVNDENVVNCYGFRVLNAGIDFADFDQNPVMLDSHINSTEAVLGNWQNRRVDGSKILMDSNFDSADPDVAKVEGKVDRGFVKGASLGLYIDFEEGTWVLGPDGNFTLMKCTCKETSVCAVPGNSGALALYNAATGELIAEETFKLSLKNLSANDLKLTNNPTMEKIILTSLALSALMGAGVTSGDNAADISRGIEKLQADLTAEKTNSTNLQTKLDAQIKLQAESLVDGAIAEEKLLAGDRAEYVEFATANYALASKQIAKLKGKASLSGALNNSEGDAAIKTVDDFEKLSDEKKLAYKEKNPEAYKKLMAV